MLRTLFAISLGGRPGHAFYRVPRALPAQVGPSQPNIVFIFSDDHAFQAISAYNDPAPADRNPADRPFGPRGNEVRSVRRPEFDLRAQPGVDLDREILASQWVL